MMKRRRTQPYYSLNTVKGLVRANKVNIMPQALYTARVDFGWSKEDICDAYLKLKPVKHYHKTETNYFDDSIQIDYYRAWKLKGENIYTHFYIDSDSGDIVIQSFKQI